MTIQVVCVKWGTKYGAADVSRLYQAVMRHASQPVRFVIVTDDDPGLGPDVVVRPFPAFRLPHATLTDGCQLKLSVFAEGVLEPDLPTVFLDLDTMIAGDVARLAALVEARPALYMLGNHLVPTYRFPGWFRRLIGREVYFANSSVMVFRPRDCAWLFETFNRMLEGFSGEHPWPRETSSDDRYLSIAAARQIAIVPNHLAHRFDREYLTLLPWLAPLVARLPSTRRRRTEVVALTFVGADFSPSRIAAMVEGDVIRRRHRRVVWRFPEISAYWRTK
jgi:hypothetical protein